MKNAGKARSYGLYRHLRTSKEIIENLLNYSMKNKPVLQQVMKVVSYRISVFIYKVYHSCNIFVWYIFYVLETAFRGVFLSDFLWLLLLCHLLM